jgi:hypothetical protein
MILYRCGLTLVSESSFEAGYHQGLEEMQKKMLDFYRNEERRKLAFRVQAEKAALERLSGITSRLEHRSQSSKEAELQPRCEEQRRSVLACLKDDGIRNKLECSAQSQAFFDCAVNNRS